jgi:hypothetical protein
MRRCALLRALAVAVLSVAPVACLSPTLPLPPPDIATIAQTSQADQWEISGDCTAGAIVTVLDQKTGLGAVYEDLPQTGFFSVVIEGTQCDVVEVWEEDANQDQSPTATYVLQATANGDPVNPTLCGE